MLIASEAAAESSSAPGNRTSSQKLTSVARPRGTEDASAASFAELNASIRVAVRPEGGSSGAAGGAAAAALAALLQLRRAGGSRASLVVSAQDGHRPGDGKASSTNASASAVRRRGRNAGGGVRAARRERARGRGPAPERRRVRAQLTDEALHERLPLSLRNGAAQELLHPLRSDRGQARASAAILSSSFPSARASRIEQAERPMPSTPAAASASRSSTIRSASTSRSPALSVASAASSSAENPSSRAARSFRSSAA